MTDRSVHNLFEQIGLGSTSVRARFTQISAGVLAVCLMSGTAYAQDNGSDVAQLSESEVEAGLDGFDMNVNSDAIDIIQNNAFEFGEIRPSLKDVAMDLPDESAGSKLLNLDFAPSACLTGDLACITPIENSLDMKYSTSFATKLDAGLDIELLPRASVRFDDDSRSALVGALVRIGDDLKDTSDFKNNTWYMFAGADAEAVTFAPNSVRRFTNGQFYLQDKVIVGDAQAGVGYRMGDADVSLGYIRREMTSFGREVNSGGVSFTEDAAALSFTWRR